MALSLDQESGKLPPGRHTATLDEFRLALVDGFPTSTTRTPLFEQFCVLRDAVNRVVGTRGQWVDGSFATTKLDPADIDIVTHVAGSDLDGLTPVDQMLLRGLVSGHYSRDMHGCDSFLLAEYAADHPARSAYERALAYWEQLFGHDRDGNPKGYVELEG